MRHDDRSMLSVGGIPVDDTAAWDPAAGSLGGEAGSLGAIRGDDTFVIKTTAQQISRSTRDAAVCPSMPSGQAAWLVKLFADQDFESLQLAATAAVQAFPSDAFAWKALGTALVRRLDGENAVKALERACELAPLDGETWNHYATALELIGQTDRFEAAIERAVVLAPNSAETLCRWSEVLGRRGEVEQMREVLDRARHGQGIAEIKRRAFSAYLFLLNYHPTKSAQSIAQEYREFDRIFAIPLRRQKPQAIPLEGRKLRIGYVSPDLRNHAVARYILPVLRHHDRNAVDIFAYAELAHGVGDRVTGEIRGLVSHWRETQGRTDQEVVDLIQRDGIDVLVDLGGQTAGARLQVFAYRPAPVSVTWIGYGYTTGVSAIDWFIADDTFAPPGCEALFCERVWRLPHVHSVFEPEADVGAVGPLPALRNGHITFGSLSRVVRINERVVAAWARILQRVPNSVLSINSANFAQTATCERYWSLFERQGIPRTRVKLGYDTPPWSVIQSFDINLDCFPHNAGTTLLEPLYGGVPLVTLQGRPSVGRYGASINHAMGLQHLTAHSEQEYEDLAVALASNVTELAALRARLRPMMEASALMNARQFTHDLEAAFKAMFEQVLATQ